ncbi:hypothetical protein N752_02780 [Desulforamulus aquiferis]|nr:hypothetical protein N752_02780 [Desulforamulus aquiferis]
MHEKIIILNNDYIDNKMWNIITEKLIFKKQELKCSVNDSSGFLDPACSDKKFYS